MDRRQFVIGSAAAAAAAATLTREAAAQDAFPSRPVTIINAFPPGGINDLVTRPAASVLETVLKQPVVVDTKAGAAGAVGAQVAANAKPDGYTILSHNNGLAGYAEVDKLFGRQPKTTRADFIPLGRLCADPVLVLVNDQQPWKTLAEFVEDAKKRPQEIVYSSGGLYGASHLPVALLEKAAGLSGMRHLPTTGGGPAITAALGNNAKMTTQTIQATLQHIKAGKLRPLANMGAERSKALPDVPTMKELGYLTVMSNSTRGIAGPKGIPAPVVSKLQDALSKAMQDPDHVSKLENQGLGIKIMVGEEYAKYFADTHVKAKKYTDWAKSRPAR